MKRSQSRLIYLSTPELPFWFHWPLRKVRILARLKMLRDQAREACDVKREKE